MQNYFYAGSSITSKHQPVLETNFLMISTLISNFRIGIFSGVAKAK